MCSCMDTPTSNNGSNTLEYHLVCWATSVDLLAGAFWTRIFRLLEPNRVLGCCLVLRQKKKKRINFI